MINIKRAYEPPSGEDGERFLVDRLWPRGVKKTSLRLTAWPKEVAPSNELRHWYGHDPKKWDEFRRRYRAELDSHQEALLPLLNAARKGTITLVYSSQERELNNAVALREYLTAKLVAKRGRTTRGKAA